MKANTPKERRLLNKIIPIATLCVALAETALIVLAFVLGRYFLFVPAGVIAVAYIVSLLIACAKVRAIEEKIAQEKFRKMVDEVEFKEEYEFYTMDTNVLIKVTKQGFVIDGETYGYDNFEIFLATANMLRQASVAVFITSNFSPYSDDRTYPINFGIVANGELLGCAKRYFFDEDYKAFAYILENPEQSAKEILRYGRLKIQIEEEKKQKKLDKLVKELESE